MLTYLLWHSEKIIINDSGKLSNSREKTFADGRNGPIKRRFSRVAIKSRNL